MHQWGKVVALHVAQLAAAQRLHLKNPVSLAISRETLPFQAFMCRDVKLQITENLSMQCSTFIK